jgi:hypothetical protein
MTIVRSTVQAGEGPSEQELERIKAELAEVEKRPINLEDFPELSPQALKEFAQLRARKQQAVPPA